MTGRRSHGRLSALNGVVHQGNASPELQDLVLEFRLVQGGHVEADDKNRFKEIETQVARSCRAIRRTVDLTEGAENPAVDSPQVMSPCQSETRARR